MEFFTIFIFLCLVQTGWSRSLLQVSPSLFNVLDNGAVGDGSIDDSEAFAKTWEAMCNSGGDNSSFQIPTGKTFLLSSVHFKGPCKSTSVYVSVQGKIVAPVKSDWKGDKEVWISFYDISGLTVDGQGQIDGSGDSWWKCSSLSPLELDGCKRPTSLKFHGCNNLHINGISSVNSPSNHISINHCDKATISHVNLTAPGNSPNTDGIDISESSNIQIHDSLIATGDDCIAINSGSSLINITNVACGPGHGISVGSLGENGTEGRVEMVHVSNCNFTGTGNGVRIKTFKGGSGYARNISFEHIILENVKNPIIIDQNYCPHSCGAEGSGVQLSDITYSGINGTSADSRAIILNCSPKVPCKNLVLNDINIVTVSGSPTTATCENCQGTSISTVPVVSCLGE